MPIVDLERARRAATVAGNWLASKASTASQAAIDKASQYLDEAEVMARNAVRKAQAAVVDGGSVPVAKASHAYQSAKEALSAAEQAVDDRVRGLLDKTKRLFGVETPAQTKQPCQNCDASAGELPPDGSLMVPSETCEKDFIPIGDPDKGVPAAVAKAKASTVSSTSACCAARPAADRERVIYYVNGINTTPAAHCKTLRMLRDMTCGKVIGVMNASEGILTDAMRTADARDMIRNEIGGGPPRTYAGFTPAVKTLQDIMVVEAAANRPVDLYAHSEGGAITSLATIRAKSVLKALNRGDAIENLTITSMGSAAPAWPDGPNYTHYIHLQDVVPNTLGLGDAAKRPGAGATVVRFGGRDGQFTTEGPDDRKRPWATFTPGKDPIGDHYADTSYLAYMNQAGGCHGKP